MEEANPGYRMNVPAPVKAAVSSLAPATPKERGTRATAVDAKWETEPKSLWRRPLLSITPAVTLGIAPLAAKLLYKPLGRSLGWESRTARVPDQATPGKRKENSWKRTHKLLQRDDFA